MTTRIRILDGRKVNAGSGCCAAIGLRTPYGKSPFRRSMALASCQAGCLGRLREIDCNKRWIHRYIIPTATALMYSLVAVFAASDGSIYSEVTRECLSRE